MRTSEFPAARFWTGLAAMLCLVFPGTIHLQGADWTSPDGVVVVTVPDAEHFVQIEPPPEPFLALWLSEDESVRLGVIRLAIPASVELTRKGMEEGFAREIGGTLTASSASMQNGHEVVLMTGTGVIEGVPALVSQAAIRHEDYGYKVMGARVGDTAADPAIDSFVKSARAAKPEKRQPLENDKRQSGGIDLREITKRIGGAGALVLIVVAAWHFSRRRKTPANRS